MSIIMELIKKNASFLRAFIASLSVKQQHCVIQYGTQEQARVVGQIAANVVSRVLHVADDHKKRLRRYKKFIRRIGSEKTTSASRLKALRSNPRPVIILLQATVPRLLKIVGTKK